VYRNAITLGSTNIVIYRSNDVPEIFSNSIDGAWVQAVEMASKAPRHEISPLTVTIQRESDDWDDAGARTRVNALLEEANRQPVEHVASTIFVKSWWNKGRPRHEYYERYKKNLPKLRSFRQNANGIYLERLINYPGELGKEGLNQLEKIVEMFNSGTRRRSAFQATPYFPFTDLKGTPYLHFPCLQQVAFIPTPGKRLTVVGFYPVHYLFQRAYGNYLGLAHLGEFMAHGMSLHVDRVMCVAGVATLEDDTVEMVRPFLERPTQNG
jgi:thymidylate synthase